MHCLVHAAQHGAPFVLGEALPAGCGSMLPGYFRADASLRVGPHDCPLLKAGTLSKPCGDLSAILTSRSLGIRKRGWFMAWAHALLQPRWRRCCQLPLVQTLLVSACGSTFLVHVRRGSLVHAHTRRYGVFAESAYATSLP